MKKTAVVLLNLGGPSSLEEVEPFLFSLFNDPAIITLPAPFRFLLAKVISKRRLKEARHIYSLLGGGSPLLENTRHQAKALSSVLGKHTSVFVLMRHADPRLQETIKDIKSFEPDEIVLLPLYPQYSTTTTGSALDEWIKKANLKNIPIHYVSEYPTQVGFIKAMKELTLPCYEKARDYGKPRVLFTAHGLPEKTIRQGDPYQNQVEETVKSLVNQLEIDELDFTLCYQSRVGPLKWIGPYTDDEITKASQQGRPLVVLPVSFVSEHSETLVELDMMYRELAEERGCPFYIRVSTVQTHPAFIQGLADLVKGPHLQTLE